MKTAILAITLLAAQSGPLVRVIDGDTLAIDGERVRLHGVDAPEIRRSGCDAEKTLGLEAKAFVEGVVATNAQIELKPAQPRPDRYGRTVAHVMVNGHDLGAMLIEAGYAAAWDYDGGDGKPGWCPK